MAAGAAAAGLAPAAADNPDALWQIVHGECVPHEQQEHSPAPCAYVELEKGEAEGYAVLKDLRGDTQFLLIPTARVERIESASILAPGAPNYWQDAWDARRFVIEAAKRPLPRDAIGMAINSELSRSQNQLHIHIDCVQPDVQHALRQHESAIGSHWQSLAEPLAGHVYEAMRVQGATLNATNPFKLLAEQSEETRAHMGFETLVVIGASFRDGSLGFYVLSAQANPSRGYFAHGEDLLDHDCRLAASLKDLQE